MLGKLATYARTHALDVFWRLRRITAAPGRATDPIPDGG